MIRLSANLGFLWPDRPLLDRIDAAARAGFRAVELHWPYDVPAARVREACARNGLALLGLNTPVGDAAAGEFGLAAVPGRGRDFRDGFARALDYAREAGAGAIHVMAGVVAPGSEAAARDAFVENLAGAAPQAEEAGVVLLLEPINPVDKPDYFYARAEDALPVMDAVGSPALRLMFDCYHAQRTTGDVTPRLARLMDRIGHVQIAAAPSRAEPDEGELDHRAVFAALERLGYAGWVGCEYRPRADTDAGLSWIGRLGLSL
ncbi:hydroxypyruvate isomerase family protein [Arenibaculum pallidiluteum]|uniref:hydroxypyruvate isomerase family protein n=1 Tax=Arenibaculum pallidiluteum TaxID=2812559 RepID=UPI001A95F89A|nr:TIM barrel protein [Arenibaculum pallidiluteum]